MPFVLVLFKKNLKASKPSEHPPQIGVPAWRLIKVYRDQIFRHERGQEKLHFPVSADHEQDWQPHPVDPYSYYMCDHTSNITVGFSLTLCC